MNKKLLIASICAASSLAVAASASAIFSNYNFVSSQAESATYTLTINTDTIDHWNESHNRAFVYSDNGTEFAFVQGNNNLVLEQGDECIAKMPGNGAGFCITNKFANIQTIKVDWEIIGESQGFDYCSVNFSDHGGSYEGSHIDLTDDVASDASGHEDKYLVFWIVGDNISIGDSNQVIEINSITVTYVC